MKRLLAAALPLLACGAPALAQAPAPRVELPIREVDLPNGDRRYAVSVAIDGKTVEVGLDTGSTGLRVLPRALGEGGLAAKGRDVDYAYGSGTKFSGKAIKVAVAFGSLAGAIDVMRIDRVGCTQAKSECPASKVSVADFGIQGDGIAGQGFAAILGIRPLRDEVDNPLRQLGITQWIVDLPRPGHSDGRLVLNPASQEIVGYRRIAFADDTGNLAGCLLGPERLGKVCGATYFDTGAAGLRVLGMADFKPWPNGTPASLAVADRDNTVSAAVVIGRRDQASGLFAEPRFPRPALSFGLAPYFKWSVLYDIGERVVGLLARD
jgi:hypothetical protein